MLTRRQAIGALVSALPATLPAFTEFPDIRTIPPDLVTPAVTVGAPGPGLRVRQTLPEYEGTEVHHALYLPVDWHPRRRYPVIVEYAGNGNYHNQYGDVSEGTVEGSNLGYGISGGRKFLWVSMPYIDLDQKRNQILWWGDAAATVDYCKKAVNNVYREFGGDPRSVFLAGFSRGAIACNYIGLRDDEIARLWLGFIAYSQYDGVKTWPYPDCDRASAVKRLERLKGRAQFIIQENSVEQTREFLRSTDIQAPFTFVTLPFRNHNDTWVLRNIPERRRVRAWVKRTLKKRPGA
jgi:hypothetical protein